MATNEIYLTNTEDSWLIEWYNRVIAPLWYTIKQWFAVALLTTGSLYASVLFNTQHKIFPLWIALPIAIGIVWTYLSGLAFATAVESKTKTSTPMIWVGAITDGLFGILYVLGQYDVIPAKPDNQIALLLAIAHIVPLIILMVIYTYCKRDYLAEQATKRKAELDRQRKIEDQDREYDLKLRNARLEVAVTKEQIKLRELEQKLTQNVSTSNQFSCDNCRASLTQGQYGAMKRNGYCQQCKPAQFNWRAKRDIMTSGKNRPKIERQNRQIVNRSHA